VIVPTRPKAAPTLLEVNKPAKPEADEVVGDETEALRVQRTWKRRRRRARTSRKMEW